MSATNHYVAFVSLSVNDQAQDGTWAPLGIISPPLIIWSPAGTSVTYRCCSLLTGWGRGGV